jgi:RHS repeat-associated protein
VYTTGTDTTPSDNTYQYTGRENDQNGLYYYRNRYLLPGVGAFASEDPMGFAAGQNEYLYTNAMPTMGRDPLGLKTLCEALQELQATQDINPFFSGNMISAALSLGQEAVPEGGSGDGDNEFQGADGNNYDIQYIQAGHAFGQLSPLLFGWWADLNLVMELINGQDLTSNTSYFDGNNITGDVNGLVYGMDGGSLDQMIEKECNKCGGSH